MNTITLGTTIKHIETGNKYVASDFEVVINKPRNHAPGVHVVFKDLTNGGVVRYSLEEIGRSIGEGETIVLDMPSPR